MRLNTPINDVSETAFLTLQCHALDAQSDRPFLNDTSAVHTLNLLKEAYSSDTNRLLYRRIFERRIKSNLIAHTALRAKKYDSYIQNFLNQYPEAAVVNIGCGLDHRFERIDNGKVTFFDLDLPDIMNIKKQVFPEKDRYKQLSISVFNFEWMDQVKNDHVILVAEGVFMYCREEDVKELFFRLQQKMENPEVVFEVFSSRWLTGWRKRVTDTKLKKELKFEDGAFFQFGIQDSDAIEGWNQGMKLMEDWSYLDSEELNSFPLKLMRRSNKLRKVQWTVHYLLSKNQKG
jgi:O-methyltransferase involved in polyketide biosynthesis